MSSAKFCSNCGASLAEDARFCGECGTAVHDTKPAPPPRPRKSRSDQKNERPALSVLSSIPWPALLIAGGAILFIVGFFLSSGGGEPPRHADNGVLENRPPTAVAPVDMALQESLPYPEVVRISAADAKAAYDNGQALFVDVRDADAFAAGHIPFTLHIPEDDVEARHPELSRGMMIITYCT